MSIHLKPKIATSALIWSFLSFSPMLALATSTLNSEFQRAVKELAEIPDRPPLATIFDSLKKYLDTGVKVESPKNTTFVENVPLHVPTIIATVESTHPGAIYVPLGRDSANLGDAIDAFYLRRGLRNRVIRFNASTSGVNGATSELIAKYLSQMGLNLSDLRSSKTIVMFDNTGYSSSSQSRKIVKAVFEVCAKTPGCSPGELTKKFTFFGTSDGDYKIRSMEIMDGVKQANYNAKDIVQLPRFPTNGLTHGDEYNGEYKQVIEQDDGQVVGIPSSSFDINKRQVIIRTMFETIQAASHRSFYHSVIAAGQNMFGVDLSTSISYQYLTPDLQKWLQYRFPGKNEPSIWSSLQQNPDIGIQLWEELKTQHSSLFIDWISFLVSRRTLDVNEGPLGLMQLISNIDSFLTKDSQTFVDGWLDYGENSSLTAEEKIGILRNKLIKAISEVIFETISFSPLWNEVLVETKSPFLADVLRNHGVTLIANPHLGMDGVERITSENQTQPAQVSKLLFEAIHEKIARDSHISEENITRYASFLTKIVPGLGDGSVLDQESLQAFRRNHFKSKPLQKIWSITYDLLKQNRGAGKIIQKNRSSGLQRFFGRAPR